ncbi:hypothetical protein FQ775_23860 [Nitratireductor mangrovi]|uniref:Uncharacterized protein n=1 Tax=Nitratireductor mangrovi TaxID=2599600 RepID=A0A6H0DYB6_9HYPH|nr:hypothetical protein [Nitratireductor mangrovi]QIS94641.1 hypothetical protein FQ775_23860 [Nitratireductor mangrovi]
MKLRTITFDATCGIATAMLETDRGRDGPRVLVSQPGKPITGKDVKRLLESPRWRRY